MKSYISVDVFEGRVDSLYGSAFSSLSNGEVIPIERNFRRTDHEIKELSNSLVSEMLSIHIQDSRSGTSEFQVKEDSLKAFTCIAGYIESQSVHEIEKANLPEHSILVRCCKTKFKPGDSGIVIACADEGKLVLVGVLTGLFKSEMTGKSYITCQEFRKGLDTLEETYGKKFFLHHDSNQQLKTSRSSEGHQIMSGSVILIKAVDVSVKSPEDIAEIDYEFVTVILYLIDNMKDDCMSSRDIEQEMQSEKRLSVCVSARGKLETPENICTSPAVTCYYLCMKGCGFLYQGKFEESIEELKAATKMITKLPCRNRMLCRLITYTTWTLLKTGRLKKMEEVLLETEPYIASMKEQAVCPNSSVGYYYFDYARYYVHKGDYHKALEKANASLAHFRQGSKPSVGKILSLAMIARLYLNCGENFERRNSTIVKSQLNEARELLSEAKELSSQTATEEVTVLLTEIDLYYRAENIKKALEITKKCLKLARENDLEEEMGRAEIRLKELTNYENEVGLP